MDVGASGGYRHSNLVTNPVMNEERTGKCLRQVEQIRGHICDTDTP